MVGIDRLKEVVSYLKEFGKEKTQKDLGLSTATLKRYGRRARELGVEEEEYEIPKVLLFDIETSPLVTYSWKMNKAYLNPDFIIEHKYLLSYSAKWLNDTEIIEEVLTSKESKNSNDERLVKKLWSLLDEVDIAIAHNGKYFDKKMANNFFIKWGLPPVSPYRILDTYRQARKNFRFESNKLRFLARKFGISEKDKTDFDLWRRCCDGSEEALTTMAAYCSQDVRALEDLYYVLRPYFTSTPNMALYYSVDKGDRCCHCGSKDLKYIGEYATNVNLFKSYRCKKCEAIMRSRHTSVSEEEKRNMKTIVAR